MLALVLVDVLVVLVVLVVVGIVVSRQKINLSVKLLSNILSASKEEN